MSDQYQEVEVVGWGSRLGSSCVGVILGIVLFFASFGVLYWNEGRIDFSKVAQTAIAIPATAPNNSAQGKLVSTTGRITSSQKLGDNLFVKAGDYIVLEREIEMYAWEENEQTETKKNLGGSETRTTTYTYTKEWTSSPEDSSSFRHTAGHENPRTAEDGFHYISYLPNNQAVEKAIAPETYTASNTKVGVYQVDIDQLRLPSLEALPLNQDRVTLEGGVSLAGDYLFAGQGSLQTPQIGDLRIHYSVLPANSTVTVFGQLNGTNQIAPYLYQKKHRFYQLFTSTPEEAIAQLKTEYTVWIWIFRLVGFLMMWIGQMLAFKPISVFLDVIPFLGSFSEGVTGITSFMVAFVLSAITILVSMLLHHPLALLLAIATTIATLAFLRRRQHE